VRRASGILGTQRWRDAVVRLCARNGKTFCRYITSRVSASLLLSVAALLALHAGICACASRT